jgi:hypothetical protein
MPITLLTSLIIIIIIIIITQCCSGQINTLATRGTAMIMKTKNYKHIEDGSIQESSHEQTTENGNRTEETQHGPSPAPPNIGATAKQGSTCNKRIRWSREEMKEVVWCFLYAKNKLRLEA